MEPRFTSRFRIDAMLRRSMSLGVNATVVRHGDDSAGTILILLTNPRRECQILTATTRRTGERVWLPTSAESYLSEADAQARIQRQIQRDPDLWVLEVETFDVQNILLEPLEAMPPGGAS